MRNCPQFLPRKYLWPCQKYPVSSGLGVSSVKQQCQALPDPGQFQWYPGVMSGHRGKQQFPQLVSTLREESRHRLLNCTPSYLIWR